MDESNQEYAAFIHDQIIKNVPEFFAQEGNILDFGCGDGLLTSYIQNSFYKTQVIGVDTNKNVIENAKKEFPSITFDYIVDVLPFTDANFDLIFAVDVFHHIKPKDHTKYVAELMRVLKPNGCIILFEVNPYNLFTYIQFKRNLLERNNTLLTPSYTYRLFQTNNCTIKLTYYFVSRYLPHCVKGYMSSFPFGSVYSVLVYKK